MCANVAIKSAPNVPAVTFRRLDASAIRRYLNQVDPLDKAGAYAIQEQGDSIVERISGSYTNVVGLPLERLKNELKYWAEVTPGTKPADSENGPAA